MALKEFVVFFFLLLAKSANSQEVSEFCAESAYSNICVKLGEKFYLIDGNAKLNWFDAERFCRRQNGYLVTIESANEFKFISDYLVLKNYLNGEHSFWTGINDLGSEGIFYSIETGNLMPFAKWSPGQPDNSGGDENCVHLWKHNGAFFMNDVGCKNRKIHLICELKQKELWHRSKMATLALICNI